MYISGKNVIKEYIRNNEKIDSITMYHDFDDIEIIDYINRNNTPVKTANKFELDKMTKSNHQGIVARVADYEYADIKDFIKNENATIVILDHLEDPHNFGAIIRTCEAAGIDGIIIPKDRSCEVTETVIKVSVGTTSQMKIAQVTNINNTLDMLKKQGYWIVGMDMDGENYTEIDYSGKIALIVGSEGFGMKRLTKESCDFIASIPMKGTVNSLNASVAAAVIIFEAIKRK